MRAALLMLASTALFALMAVFVRLATQSLHAFEVAFFRNVFGLVAALPLLLHHGPQLLRTTQFPRYLFRSLIGVCSMIAGFWAIGHLPLAQAISLTYSTPLFVTLAAAAMLGEVVRARRWAAVIVGFIGVLVIVQPGSVAFNDGTLMALLSAVLSAIVAIQIKQLSDTEPADRIVFYTVLLWVPMSLVPALGVWRGPEGQEWLWLAGAGFSGTVGHMLWTRALKLGEVSALTPISFMQLPIVMVFGWLMFGESPDRWLILGALIIFSANAYIAHREVILSRRAASEAPSAAAKPSE